MKTISPKTCKTVRLVYGAVFSAFTVVVGALFIWQVLKIYGDGAAAGLSSPFSREKVSAGLKVIAAPFWIWIAMIFAGFILWEVFPCQKPALRTDARYALYRLKKRMPANVTEEYRSQFCYVKNQERILKILWIICAAAGVCFAIGAIVYLAIPSHFPNIDVNGEILDMVKVILPCVFVEFLLCCGVAVFEGKSAQKQLEYVKQLVKAPAAEAEVSKFGAFIGKVKSALGNKYVILGVRIAVGAIGVAFVIAGVFNQSIKDVLVKAINICTECIGLG